MQFGADFPNLRWSNLPVTIFPVLFHSPLYVPPLSFIQSSRMIGRLEKSGERADSNTEG